jgi:hypothetical protein
MPLYKYTASTQDGQKMVKGEMQAADKADLQEQLAIAGLFLVQWKIQEAPSSGALGKYLGSLSINKVAVKYPAYWIISACVITGFLSWFSQDSLDRNVATAGPPPAIAAKIQQVHEGLKRKDVEMLFRAVPATSLPPTVSRYFEPPETYIHVSYQLSDSSRSKDTVKGVVSVYRANR